jgi:hypothetical protein
MQDVSCSPTGSSCVAVGHRWDEDREPVAAIQRWDGATWQAETPPEGTEDLVEVDCGTPTDCVALEQPRFEGDLTRRIAARSAAGWRWVDFSVATPGVELTRASCASPTSCVLAGPGRDVALFDGTTVRALPRTPVNVTALSCPSASYCAAVGDAAFVEWDGATWTTTALEDSAVLLDVDCWAAQSCLATTGYDSTTTWVRLPGVPWRPDAAPTGRPYQSEGPSASSLECTADGACHLLRLVGPRRAQAPELHSWSAGAWVSSRIPETEGSVVALGCRPGECLVMDVVATGLDQPVRTSVLHGYGSQWSRSEMVHPLGVLPITYPLEGACPAPGWCLAIGNIGPLGESGTESYVVRGDGADWHEMPAALKEQRDLDCWRPGRCVVVGSDGTRPSATQLRNGRWHSLPPMSPSWLATGTITGVGCAGPRCVYSGYYRPRHGAGTGIFVARREAGSWDVRRLGPMIPGEPAFTGRPSVDCPTAGRCVVVISARLAEDRKPTSYEAVLEDGRWSWTTVGRGFSLFELDCADALHCIAGGALGRPGLIMARGPDGMWRRVAVSTRNAAFYSVSCPTARACYAVGTGSRVQQLVRSRAGWQARATGPSDMADIVCTRVRTCIAFNELTAWSSR